MVLIVGWIPSNGIFSIVQRNKIRRLKTYRKQKQIKQANLILNTNKLQSNNLKITNPKNILKAKAKKASKSNLKY